MPMALIRCNPRRNPQVRPEADVRQAPATQPRVDFFSFFAARFSFSVFAGCFFVSFFLSRPLAMGSPGVVGLVA